MALSVILAASMTLGPAANVRAMEPDDSGVVAGNDIEQEEYDAADTDNKVTDKNDEKDNAESLDENDEKDNAESLDKKDNADENTVSETDKEKSQDDKEVDKEKSAVNEADEDIVKTGTFKSEETIEISVEMKDNDALFNDYVERVFRDPSFTVSTNPQIVRKQLSGAGIKVYEAIMKRVDKVASGETSSTSFEIQGSEFGITEKTFTKEELGIEKIDDDSFSDTLKAAEEKILEEVDREGIFDALCNNVPYALYWFDKTTGIIFEPVFDYSFTEDEFTITDIRIVIELEVSEDYADKNADNSYGHFTTDLNKTKAASKAASKAAKIVAENEDKSDYEKLEAYRKEICDLVSYDFDSLQPSVYYGDPWQVISVFDQDPSTNVVCEGYAKAFKQLCDISEFDDDTLNCIIVTGNMDFGTGAGRHMWNVVTIDNKNYLVDITNCDEGSVGYPDKFFLRGKDSKDQNGSVENGYTIYADDSNYLKYSYDSVSTNLHFSAELELAKEDYDSSTAPHKVKKGFYNEDGKVVLYKDDKIDERSGLIRDERSGRLYNVVNGYVENGPRLVTFENDNYYVNESGYVDENYSGRFTNSDGIWYIVSGKVDKTKNGLYLLSSTWYNFKDGKVKKGVDLVQNHAGWWHVNKDGIVDFKYNGISSNQYGDWYTEKSKVDFGKNGLYKFGNTWYNFSGGKVAKKEALVFKSNVWWYVNKNGVVDYEFKGVVKGKNGDWYVENGKINFSVNGLRQCGNKRYNFEGGKVAKKEALVYSSNIWWYVNKNGVVDDEFKGIAKGKNGDWYIENGKINFSVNGLKKCGNTTYNLEAGKVVKKEALVHSSNIWWYVNKNGVVDYKFKGVVKGKNGDWYIENGKINFSVNGLKQCGNVWYNFKGGKVVKKADIVSNNAGSWYVNSAGRVDFNYTGLAQNVNGWWYIQKGKVNYSHNGLATNKGGTWYVANGKVDFSKNGIIYIPSKKAKYNFKGGRVTEGPILVLENKAWVCVNEVGKVDYSYTGIAKNQYGNWYCKDGKVAFSFSGEAPGKLNGVNSYWTVRDGKVTGRAYYGDIDAESVRRVANLSSDTEYIIMVNKSEYTVDIFRGSAGRWSIVEAFPCTVGKSSTPTVEGTFTVQERGYYFDTPSGYGYDVRCFYYTQFYGDYLFHTVIYEKDSYPKNVWDGRLGVAASHGCVRMSVEGAKWIYDNIPRGTKVVVFH